MQDGIATGTMKEAGINGKKISALITGIESGVYPNIHGLMICRKDRLVYENYWSGKDESWGTNLGVVAHDRDSLHDLRSISKSIVSACVGIAIQQGKMKSVDQRVFDFFPQYAAQDTGLKAALTIEHLLTMSSDLAWNEEVPYDNPANSEGGMIRSADPIAYVLTQPMESPAGKVWKYNGGTTQLLAAIIEKATGKRIDRFANAYLFAPLGIKRFEWAKYPGTDMPAAASGLRLFPRDLLKFGLLYSHNGAWQGKQVVPASWVATSLQSHIDRPESGAYGYQFWIFTDTYEGKPVRIVACVGNGGQRILLDKERDLVVVVTSGNYNKWNIKKTGNNMLKDPIYPSLIK